MPGDQNTFWRDRVHMTSQNKAFHSPSLRKRPFQQLPNARYFSVRANRIHHPFFPLGATSHIYHVDREGRSAKENEIEIPPQGCSFWLVRTKRTVGCPLHSVAPCSSFFHRHAHLQHSLFLGVFLGPPGGGSPETDELWRSSQTCY